MSKTLVIGDLHEPASRVGYLQFCQDLYYEWDCDNTVFIGDVVDWHGISFWAKEPQCPGPADEYKLAKQCVEKWAKAFPKAHVCIGNHDERPSRLAKTVNIPEFMLKPYSELWDAPGWQWDYRFTFDGVSYRHGTRIGSSSIHPAWNLMNKIHKSCVIGHFHSRAGIKWGCNEDMRFFGADVGCGIDEKAFQFIYGKDDPLRPFISALIVIDGIPYLEPCPIGRREKYHDSKFKKRKGKL